MSPSAYRLRITHKMKMRYLLLCPLLLHLVSAALETELKDMQPCDSVSVESPPCRAYEVRNTPLTQKCLITSRNVSDITVGRTFTWELHVKPADGFRSFEVAVTDADVEQVVSLKLGVHSLPKNVWHSVILEDSNFMKLKVNNTPRVMKKKGSGFSPSQVFVISEGPLTWTSACDPVDNVTPDDTPGLSSATVVVIVVVAVVHVLVVAGIITTSAHLRVKRRLRREAPDCYGCEVEQMPGGPRAPVSRALGCVNYHTDVTQDCGSSASDHIHQGMIDSSVPVDGDSEGNHGQEVASLRRARNEEERSRRDSYSRPNSLYIPFTELDLSPSVLEDHGRP